MIEVYKVPTSKLMVEYAEYKQRINNKKLNSRGLIKIVFYQTNSEGLETGKVGETHIALIPVSEMVVEAGNTDILLIEGQKYKILEQKLVKAPNIKPYWKTKLKTV